MTMFNPPHPGSILKEDVLPELGLGVTEAAAQLGVLRCLALSMAARLSVRIWMNSPTAESWVRMQAEYDLWQARQKPRPNIKPG
ncbi:MAG: HigA family addiction module antitoxin [Methylococcaceae bacterium]